MTVGLLLYLGQLANEIVRVGLSGSELNLFIGDSFTTKANILSDGRAEEDRLLADDSDVLTQPVDVVMLYVMTVD